MSPRVLVADDDEGVRYTLVGMLEDAGLEVVGVADGADAWEALQRAPSFDLLVSDLRMPGLDGLALLSRIRDAGMRLPVVMVTAHGSERTAVEAIKRGAYDYLRKPFEPDELTAVVERALEAARLRADNERLAGELALARTMTFRSPAMSRLAQLVQRVAARDVTVLITGESGTGKEGVADAIVRASPRAERPFVRFNCAALTPELAEAELFGHSRGAFTGAHRARTGLIREADGGTLLLDEVGELHASTQAKLLRVLQEREVRPVGEDASIAVDVRVLAATHRDLPRMAADGLFREDLYYRLNVVHLHVPPLRDRPEDILPLARHFFDRYMARFGTGPLRTPLGWSERLMAHRWPGNVRELENALESVVALSSDGTIELSLLPGSTSAGVPSAADPRLTLRQRLDAYERGLIVTAIAEVHGNRSEAARRLGLGRTTLHDKLRKYGLGDDRDG